MKFLAQLLLALTVMSQAAQIQATTWRSEFECFVKLHYTQLAYGKTVSQVMAHIGVEQLKGATWMGATAETEWANVQDVRLKREGQAFLGQAVLKGETGKFGPYFKDFVVQYWVNFEDGTSFISPVYPITVQTTKSTSSWEDYEKARATLIEQSSLQPFWESTSCEQIEKITVG
jgi:hypothetical protein